MNILSLNFAGFFDVIIYLVLSGAEADYCSTLFITSAHRDNTVCTYFYSYGVIYWFIIIYIWNKTSYSIYNWEIEIGLMKIEKISTGTLPWSQSWGATLFA